MRFLFTETSGQRERVVGEGERKLRGGRVGRGAYTDTVQGRG